jgi:hypothetical protein
MSQHRMMSDWFDTEVRFISRTGELCRANSLNAIVASPLEPRVQPVAIGQPFSEADDARYLDDTQALDLIAAEMSGESWSTDTLEVIAAYVRGTDRYIAEVEPENEEVSV